MNRAAQKTVIGCMVCCLAWAAFPSDLSAQGKPPGTIVTPASAPRESFGGPYCGIYSLYAALRTLDIAVNIEDLIQDRYVGSAMGSSLTELRQAAQDFGVHALAVDGLTASALRASRYPIILHVRRPGKDAPYLHWVLFLGTQGDRVRIVDPPNTVESMSFAQLLSLSDGVGLVVSNEEVGGYSVAWSAWFDECFIILCVGLLLATARVFILVRAAGKVDEPRSRLRWGHWFRSLRTAGGLVALSGMVALAWHLLSDVGLLANRDAVAEAIGHHFQQELSALPAVEVARFLGASDVTLIDARLPRAFKAGHLKGAINLPITAGLIDRERVLSGVARSNRVVVYCQSDKCHWAESIGSDLYFRGYRNVYLFPGGWVEWKKYERSARSH